MDITRFRSLSARQRALAALAILVDDNLAGLYLENDAVNGQGMRRVIDEFLECELEVRVAMAGTLLRDALAELSQSKV